MTGLIKIIGAGLLVWFVLLSTAIITNIVFKSSTANAECVVSFPMIDDTRE